MVVKKVGLFCYGRYEMTGRGVRGKTPHRNSDHIVTFPGKSLTRAFQVVKVQVELDLYQALKMGHRLNYGKNTLHG